MRINNIKNLLTKKSLSFFLLIYFVTVSQMFAQGIDSTEQSQLVVKLKSFPEIVSVTKLKNNSFNEVLEVSITQPIDHTNPNSKTFTQRLYIGHMNFNNPVVINTQGYSANRFYRFELSSILNANQIIVENRYFGKSMPDTLIWNYLTSKQVAEDIHHITRILKKIYKNKWVSTGISKGGQTCLFYRKYYPDDVDATVAYVAPINPEQENRNINKFISSEVGTKKCRKRIEDFQLLLLDKEKELLPIVKKYSEKKKYKFRIGIEKAFEYGVLEYPFSFWQWGAYTCDSIPSDRSTLKNIFNKYIKVSSLGLYSDKTVEYLGPLFYQSYNELGYYNFKYNSEQVISKLKYVTNLSNNIFLPQNVRVEYNPAILKSVINYLQNEGNNIIYVYGGNDPWSSGAAIDLIGKTNSFKIVKKNGTHASRILNLDEKQKDKIYNNLKKWLNLKKINRL